MEFTITSTSERGYFQRLTSPLTSKYLTNDHRLSRFTKSERWLSIAIALCEFLMGDDASIQSEDSIANIVRKSYGVILSKMTDTTE